MSKQDTPKETPEKNEQSNEQFNESNTEQSNEPSGENNTGQSNEPSGENNLELHGLKFLAKMKAKREQLIKNMEGMSKSEKVKYIFYYYKWHMILTVLLIFCAIAIPLTIYRNTRPVAVSYAILNCTDINALNLSIFDEYMDYYGFDNGYQIIKNLSVQLDLDTYEEAYQENPNSSNFTQFPMLCYNDYYDILITDEAGMKYCSVNSLIKPIKTIFSSDVTDLLYDEYSDRIIQAADYSETYTDYAIDISDTDFAKTLNLGYEKVYLCFPGISEQNIGNAKRILNFIFHLNLAI